MNAADFSVDPGALELLKFEVAAYRMLTNRDPVPYYNNLNWATESQHVFRDNLKRASTALVKEEAGPEATVIDYSEFRDKYPDPLSDSRLRPLAQILKDTESSLTRNPVFWTRTIGYAYLCQQFIAVNGRGMGFTDRNLDVGKLVSLVKDPEISSHAAEQESIFRAVVAEGL